MKRLALTRDHADPFFLWATKVMREHGKSKFSVIDFYALFDAICLYVERHEQTLLVQEKPCLPTLEILLEHAPAQGHNLFTVTVDREATAMANYMFQFIVGGMQKHYPKSA